MTVNAAIGWLIPGFAITVVDAWLSIQSLTGIMQPRNPLAVIAAGLLGAALTVFAVISPVWGELIKRPAVQVVRYLLLAADIATSIVGAVWYGVLGHKLDEPVDFHLMHFDLSNWFVTSLFVAVVVGVAFVCHKFGKAMKRVAEYRDEKRRAEEERERHRDRVGRFR